MAKRAKATRTAGARPKAEQAEPFFRPFSKLNVARSRKIADQKAEGEKPPAPPKGTRPPASVAAAPAAKSKGAAAAPPPEAEAPVDPHTFAVYMAGVRTLAGGRGQRIPATASKIERAAPTPAEGDPDEGARTRMRSLVTEGIRFETIDDGERLEGRRLDVDPRELRRLRRAQYAIDGKLDLHGLGADEARHALDAFIEKRAVEGDRVVLVVHGKGSHSPRGHAVLRGEIAAWLSQGRSARHVAAFATAPDDHGGAGAVLVLLAR